MPTRTEAAQALYEAAKGVGMNWRAGAPEGLDALGIAITRYEDATPDALPAEVARVVEAAARWHYAPEGGPALAAHCEMRDAIKAYCERVQFAQPDPLPARLARLKPGSVVEVEFGVMRFSAKVLDNDTRLGRVRLQYNLAILELEYSDIRAILSEAP